MQVTRKIKRAFMTALALLTVAAGAGAQAAAPRGLLGKVRATNGRSLQADQHLLASLGQQRALLGRILVAEVNSPHPDTRAEAIYLLAVFRLSRGTHALLNHIGFEFQVPPSSKIFVAPPGPYPAVWALVRVGIPSVRAILTVLPWETNQLRCRLMIKVMVGVEGRAVTRFRLQRAIAKAATPPEKANLTAALADIPAATR